MLRIEIPSTGQSNLSFNDIAECDIPAPLNGFSSEINNNVILSFDDEQQALDYAHDLDNYAGTINPESKPYLIIADIIKAIGDDGFVQSYVHG